MPDDAHEEHLRQHDAMRHLTAMLVKQDGINDRLTLTIERIDQTLAQQGEINADVKTTLARIGTLLARLIRPADKGHEA